MSKLNFDEKYEDLKIEIAKLQLKSEEATFNTGLPDMDIKIVDLNRKID